MMDIENFEDDNDDGFFESETESDDSD